jgi:glycosyltransferase involved in cell wall biosynthesis
MFIKNSSIKNEIKLSLILATYGRLQEVFDFCESLNLQTCDLSGVELVIVDQNDNDELRNGIINIRHKYKIIYIKSTVKGLSFARNLGIDVAKGQVIGYPDDDCIYYSNTLEEVIRAFDLNSGKKLILGRIFDRESGRNIIKNWPVINRTVKFTNYFRFCNSVTLFHTRDSKFHFDNSMGAGQYFGSCEDVDFIYRWLENKNKAEYIHSIDVWHPEFRHNEVSLKKVRSYARGFGFFVRKKHVVSWPKYMHLVLLIFYKIIQFIINLHKKRFKSGYFSNYFLGIIDGLFLSQK